MYLLNTGDNALLDLFGRLQSMLHGSAKAITSLFPSGVSSHKVDDALSDVTFNGNRLAWSGNSSQDTAMVVFNDTQSGREVAIPAHQVVELFILSIVLECKCVHELGYEWKGAKYVAGRIIRYVEAYGYSQDEILSHLPELIKQETGVFSVSDIGGERIASIKLDGADYAALDIPVEQLLTGSAHASEALINSAIPSASGYGDRQEADVDDTGSNADMVLTGILHPSSGESRNKYLH